MTELGAEIEAAALATPGVLALYRAGSLVNRLLGAATDRLGLAEEPASRVVVVRTNDATEVEIAIGIESAASAVETAEAVRSRLIALLIERGEPRPALRITVVHVADGRALAPGGGTGASAGTGTGASPSGLA